MASSVGKTVEGTDGSDHLFRERIASQYKISASYKSKLRLHLLFSLIPWAVVFCHFVQSKLDVKLTNQVLPSFEQWEKVYLCNIIMLIVGNSSLQRNKASVLNIFKFGTAFVGVLPLVFGFVSRLSELKMFVLSGRFNAFLFGQPLPIVYYGFIVMAMSINSHCIYCSVKLLEAWNSKGFKNK